LLLVLLTLALRGGEIAPPPPNSFANDTEFLQFLQRKAFDYFWLEANPTNGLVPDRSRTNSHCSIAATGFGLTAIGIGVDHGWITREEGRQRTLTTLRTFHDSPQGPDPEGVIGHRGWFYHFLDMNTGRRAWKCELSSIDTALFLAGAVYAREFFDGPHPDEAEIRQLVNAIYRRIDWSWMATGTNSLSMGWHPETGFIKSRWTGYNEAMILLLLGLGAPGLPTEGESESSGNTGNDEALRSTPRSERPRGNDEALPSNPIVERLRGNDETLPSPLDAALPSRLGPEFWTEWTRTYEWRTSYGQSFVHFPPLFGHQYSHCWIDFRGIADDYLRGKGIDYFENSRRATLAQQAYCIENPGRFKGYSALVWGLTACDGPGRGPHRGYSARGAPPAENDDGTIAPTAAGASLPFAPEICLPTLRHFYDRFRPSIWTRYGFCDAFNLSAGWWDPEVLGIDQGPILIMIENHLTGRVWKTFMKAPEIQRGLKRAGFAPNQR